MRILAFLLSRNEYGRLISGEERRFLEISSHLSQLGVEIFAFEYRPSVSESWGYSGYHSIKLEQKFMRHYTLEAIRLIIHALKSCIIFNCDLIYVPGGFPWSLNVILPAYVVSLVCRKPLVPVFHHLHRHAGYHTLGIAQKIMILLALKHAKTCISVSKATAHDIKENFKVRNLAVTGNGVNTNRFKNFKEQAKFYTVAYFGRIAEEKGIQTLIKAWKIVTKSLPSAKLLLIGGMEKSTGEKYRKIVKKLGLEQIITFTGFVSDQEAVNLLNLSEIFVLPSTEEGFGLTVLEAMVIGLPCIVSDLPALRENFKEVAILVKPNNVEELAEAILNLLSDPDRHLEFRKRGRKLAEKLSWTAVARREFKVLKMSLANSP